MENGKRVFVHGATKEEYEPALDLGKVAQTEKKYGVIWEHTRESILVKRTVMEGPGTQTDKEQIRILENNTNPGRPA